MGTNLGLSDPKENLNTLKTKYLKDGGGLGSMDLVSGG